MTFSEQMLYFGYCSKLRSLLILNFRRPKEKQKLLRVTNRISRLSGVLSLFVIMGLTVPGSAFADEAPVVVQAQGGGHFVPVKPVEAETSSRAPNASSDAERGRFNAIGANEEDNPLSKATTSENEDFDSDEGSVGRPRSIPSTTILPSTTLTPKNISSLPEPTIHHLGRKFRMPLPAITKPSGAGVNVSATKTSRGILLTYNTKGGSFAGGGFTYDHFGSTKFETVDLSSRTSFKFGLKGNAKQVKFEVVDSAGKKASVILKGIIPGKEQVWVIPTSKLKRVNLKKVRILYFIVEGSRQRGSLRINRIPS